MSEFYNYPEIPREKNATFPPAHSPETMMQFERYRDLAREAEQARLIRLAREGAPRKRNLLSQALTGLGHLLVRCGCVLEQRYSALLEPPCADIRNRSTSSTTADQGIG